MYIGDTFWIFFIEFTQTTVVLLKRPILLLRLGSCYRVSNFTFILSCSIVAVVYQTRTVHKGTKRLRLVQKLFPILVTSPHLLVDFNF
jgi:hypothetical protein